MPAGFDIRGEDVSGTNGAVVLLLETLARRAAQWYGPADPLAAFLHGEREGWFVGKYVFLDEPLAAPADRAKFLAVLGAAEAELLAGDEYSDSGRDWLRTAAAFLRERLAALTASTAPPP